MQKLFAYLFGGLWGYLIVFIGSSTATAIMTYQIVHTANAVTISNLKLASATKAQQETQQALDKLSEYIGRMHTSELDYQWYMQHIDDQFGKLSGDLKHVQKQNPLPPNCRPDAARVRNLQAAVRTTNEIGTLKPNAGPAMSKNP